MVHTRLAISTVAVVLFGAWYASVPPAATSLADADGPPVPVRGAVHVHTERSDGSGSVDAVAAAASAAGLDFVVITDHGDASREPDPPAYLHGVLVIDGVEISTSDGHVLALGLPQAPFPLGGEARDVVADIARLGGMSIAAHPDSAKSRLRWEEWDAPLDGLEWLNADSGWRDESLPSLVRALFTYPVRPAETIAALLDRPEALFAQWDRLSAARPVSVVAGGDAHARIGLRRSAHEYSRVLAIPVPAYESVFRAFSIALPGVAFGGAPADDARQVLAAIKGGHLYSVVDALAGPVGFSFSATSGAHRGTAGDLVPIDGPVALEVVTTSAPGSRIVLLRNGEAVAVETGDRLLYIAPPEPGVYRVEVLHPAAPGNPPVPWVVSNPIHVGRSVVPDARPRPVRLSDRRLVATSAVWGVEANSHSQGAIDNLAAVGRPEHVFRYGLGGAPSDEAFVAFVTRDVEALAASQAIVFTGYADRPMRLSVQVRAPRPDGGLDRWQRSVYLDQEAREVAVFFDEMRPVAGTDRRSPTLDDVDSVLLVVDTTNTPLGTNGRIIIGGTAYARAPERAEAPR